MDIQKELYDAAARLTGASAVVMRHDDFELNDDLIAANQLICSALEAAMAVAGALASEKPEVTR